ncbi:MAG TPA: nucleoside recognition domain-containing protein, partial [Flavobacterium sp.]|nr:nucleoside recognition domain-containing protein [Flavobacterium sp.]
MSRFWLVIFISSIVFVIFSLFSGNSYTIDNVLNGKKDDPILISEKYIDQVPAFIKDSINKSEEKTFIINRDTLNADTTYVYKNKVVKIFSGVQKSDGLLPTCKSTLLDLILPLMAYLAFFCGLMELLIISGVSEKLAKVLSPVFVKVFPSIPKNHPSISYMTLNFAANFLGLDSAATPFGLKAMESLQEINPEKDKASDAQIMFMCLHASGLTLIATSIIGYRAAAGASNPADVMLPCIITSFIGTIAAFLIVGIKQKINFKSASLVLGLMVLIAAIVGLLMYVNHFDLIGKNYFTSNLSALILVGIIVFTLIFSFIKEKKFTEANTTVYETFVVGANNGVKTGVTIFPYVLGM